MKYKIFINYILTATLLSNSCILVAMEYVRKDAPEEYEKAQKALESQKTREEAQRKTPPTAKEQADMSKLISVGYSQKEAEAIARKKTEAGGVTVEAALKARETKTDAAAKKLTETVVALPDPFKVREEAKKREEEAAKKMEEEEAAKKRAGVRLLPGTGTIVPELSLPTGFKPKPLETTKPIVAKPLSGEQTGTQIRETEEAIKKQTEELRRLNASDTEIEYLMKLEPKTRALEIQKLRESISREVAGIVRDTTKSTTAKPLSAESTESQVREIEEATRKQTEALEQQETMKKQTADLKQLGISDLDIENIMKMSPQQRDETVKKLKESQAKKSETQTATPPKTAAQTEQEFNGIQKELANLMARKGRNKSKMTPEKVNALQIKLLSSEDAISHLRKQIEADKKNPDKQKQVKKDEIKLQKLIADYNKTETRMKSIQKELTEVAQSERDLRLKSYEISKQLINPSSSQQRGIRKNLNELVSIQDSEVKILKQKVNTLKTDTIYNLDDKVDELKKKLSNNPNSEFLQNELKKKEAELEAAKARLEAVEKELVPASKLLDEINKANELEKTKYRVENLKKFNTKRLAADTSRYIQLTEKLKLADPEDTEGKASLLRKKKELENIYGAPPTQFKTPEEAVKFNQEKLK